MSHVLVTGAGGFVGRHLVAALQARGQRVSGLGRGGEGALAVDLRRPAGLQHLLERDPPDLVLHLAAMASPAACAADPEGAVALHVGGTRALVEALGGGGRLVHISTVHVYGNPTALPVTVDHPLRPQGAYATSKARGEEEARRHPNAVVVRPFHIAGRGQRPGYALADWAAALRSGALPIPVGDLSLARDFLDVADAVLGILQIAKAAPPGATVNLCSGEAHRLDQWLRWMNGGSLPAVSEEPGRFRSADPRELRGDAGPLRVLGVPPPQDPARWARALVTD